MRIITPSAEDYRVEKPPFYLPVAREDALFEQYRRLGEMAMAVFFQEHLRFPELTSGYEKIESLLGEARKLKEHGGHGGKP